MDLACRALSAKPCLSVLPACLLVFLYFCLCLFVGLFTSLFIYLLACLSLCLPVCLLVCLPGCPSSCLAGIGYLFWPSQGRHAEREEWREAAWESTLCPGCPCQLPAATARKNEWRQLGPLFQILMSYSQYIEHVRYCVHRTLFGMTGMESTMLVRAHR